MARYTACVKFWEDLEGSLRDKAIEDYISAHPEKVLLAFVQNELSEWQCEVEQEESDKYVMLTAMNYVNCIAYVPLQ